MSEYPYLDMHEMIRDCDTLLGDLAWCVARMQADTDGAAPPDADGMLIFIQALRRCVARLRTPALEAAIAEERTRMHEEADRWEPS
jgi:hypothetical protein